MNYEGDLVEKPIKGLYAVLDTVILHLIRTLLLRFNKWVDLFFDLIFD